LPGDPNGYPTRDEVAAYLERYGHHFEHGVVVRPRAVGADRRTVRFADSTELEVDVVIWATGYRPDHSWIDLRIHGDDGRLRHRRGVSDVAGLYFRGLSWQHTRGSALLGFVADDAGFIASQLDDRGPGAQRNADPAPQAAGATEGAF
jgi:putative flavoprotein involved in K+ transport